MEQTKTKPQNHFVCVIISIAAARKKSLHLNASGHITKFCDYNLILSIWKRIVQ